MFASSAAVTARFGSDSPYKNRHLWPEEDADGVRSVLRHSTLADQDCLHALVHRSYQGASRVALCNPKELTAEVGERISLLLAPPYFALHPAPDRQRSGRTRAASWLSSTLPQERQQLRSGPERHVGTSSLATWWSHQRACPPPPPSPRPPL